MTYQLYSTHSPNVYKVAMMLEELGASWQPTYLAVTAGAQFTPEFRSLSPNAKVPVLVDHAPEDAGEPLAVWESGAILLYLAERHGRFLPQAPRARATVLQWLFWQMAGLGPMSGQQAHFRQFDGLIPAGNDYAAARFARETGRLLAVLDRQLERAPFIAGADYSVADMACYPWVRILRILGFEWASYPALSAWARAVDARPATAAAYARIDALPRSTATPEERYRIMCTDRPDVA